MKQAKIAEFKANLSAYLLEVRNGATVVVCDRVTPIARLVPYQEPDDLEIIAATDPAREARKIKAVKLLKPIDVDRILRETRAQR